jgi:tRNA(adenine34) deaminase
MNSSPTDDAGFVRRATTIAREADQGHGAVPIGCVVVMNGEVLGEGANQLVGKRDPTAHAEIVAIRRAAKPVVTSFHGATLYSTLQLCGRCRMGSIWSHVFRIVSGAERRQVHSMYFEDLHFDTMDFIRDAFRDDISLTGGVLSEEGVALYYKRGDNVPEDEQGNV